MSFAMKMEITGDSTTPFLRRLQHSLRDLSGLNKTMAVHQEELFRGHVSAIASRRHQTANRLGATPTGHLEKASQSIEASGSEAGVDIRWPRSTGLQRAFGDLIIVPKNSNYLTMPVHKLAYGKRAREFADLVAIRVGGEQGSRSVLILARKIRGQEILETLYLLLKKVIQKQDRGLLPDDIAILQAAELGAREYIDNLKGGNN